VIRLDLGDPPTRVRNALERSLGAAVVEWNNHGIEKAKKTTDRGYAVVKEDLFARQLKKCAYCERRPGFDGQAVEHFRPRKHAERALPGEASDKDQERYWWLAWHWENLFFACTTCNGRARKGNRFPLADTGRLPIPPRDQRDPR